MTASVSTTNGIVPIRQPSTGLSGTPGPDVRVPLADVDGNGFGLYAG
ncbi:MAG TPA: hypothetical protein VFI21_07920 [Nocardioides sp.]|jgi:hypothetical protein|nr:hypothetical protein [Nocardioides sp.]